MQSLSLQVVASVVLQRQSYLWCVCAAKEVYYHISAALSLDSWALLMFVG